MTACVAVLVPCAGLVGCCIVVYLLLWIVSREQNTIGCVDEIWHGGKGRRWKTHIFVDSVDANGVAVKVCEDTVILIWSVIAVFFSI